MEREGEGERQRNLRTRLLPLLHVPLSPLHTLSAQDAAKIRTLKRCEAAIPSHLKHNMRARARAHTHTHTPGRSAAVTGRPSRVSREGGSSPTSRRRICRSDSDLPSQVTRIGLRERSSLRPKPEFDSDANPSQWTRTDRRRVAGHAPRRAASPPLLAPGSESSDSDEDASQVTRMRMLVK